MRGLINTIDYTLRLLLIGLAIFMVLTVTWQVVSRYALRAPSSLTEEIARYQLIWLGLLGAVYTFRNRMHVGIDILIGNWTGRKRIAAELASLICCIIFAVVVLIWGGGSLVLLTHELNQTSAALGIRISWVYSIIPMSGVLWVIYGLYYMNDILRHGRIRIPTEVSTDSTTPGQAVPDPTLAAALEKRAANDTNAREDN